VRLDEWQRYIDSEFVEPGNDEKQPKSGARSSTGPAEPGNSVEVPPSGRSLETNGTNAELEVPVDSTRVSSEPSLDPVPEVAPTVTTLEPMDASDDHALDTIDAANQPDPPANGIKSVDAVDSEIPPLAAYISARRSGKESPVSQAQDDHVPALKSAFNDAQSPGNENTTVLAGDTGYGTALDPATPYPLTAPSIILEQLQAGPGTNCSSTDPALAQRREGLLRRLLDPALSIDDAALILGVSVAAVRQYAEGGLLRACEAPRNSGRNSRGASAETRPRYFRLSDITRFAASRAHEDEPGSLFAQRVGSDQAS
jgi:hypothetical protein